MPTSDDRLAQLALKEGKVAPHHLAAARELVTKMAALGVKRDLLGALVDREVLTSEEADRLRRLAASAEGGGALDEAAEAAAARVASPPVVERPSPGVRQVASGESGQAVCHRHPGRAALLKCKACGKPLCSECVVQTPDGVFCGEACFLGFSPFGGGESAGAAAGPERMHRRAWPFVAVVVLVPAVIVAAVYLRPSEALKRARRLKTKVADLEAKGQTAKALEAAQELASMTPKGGPVKEIVSWGGSRSKVLKRKIGMAAVGSIRDSLAALATGSPEALSKKRKELDALASRFPDVGEVTEAIHKLRGDVDMRLSAARSRAKAPKRGGAGAARAARPGAAKRLPSLAKLRADVDRLVKAQRFAEARGAVEKVRRDMGARAARSVHAQLSRLEARTLGAAREAYAAEDRKAQALVSKGNFTEARRVYRRLTGDTGIDEIAVRARKALESVDRAERTALQRADLGRAAEAVAKARQLIDSFDYTLAQAVLQRARQGLETEAARAEADLWLDIARREHAVLRKIAQMIGAKPLDLETLQSGGPKRTKGVMFKADEAGYSVRVKFKAGGTSVMTAPWGKLPADQLGRLAKLAAGEEKETLVGLALFCGARGARAEATWAIGLLRRSGDKDAEGLEERYAARLSPPSGTGEAGDEPRDAGKVAKAGADPGAPKRPKDAAPGEAKAGREGDGEGKQEGKQEKEKKEETVPRNIETSCGFCTGSGLLKRLGCRKCAGTGYINVDMCGTCGGMGESDYPCPFCKGNSVVVVEGRAQRCRGCAGRGYPGCVACRGTGKIKRQNRKAAGVPTQLCRLCDASGLDKRLFKCKRCGGGGSREVTHTTANVTWVRRVTCGFCRGKGKSRPKCRKCSGKGFHGRGVAFPSGESRVPCRPCFGTGDLVSRCRACGGRGWIKTE